MFDLVGAEFSGFVQATNQLNFSIPVTGGAASYSTSPAVWPGGADSDPLPGALCVPISGGFQVFRTTSLGSGFVWKTTAGISSPIDHWQTPGLRGWQTQVHIEYEEGSEQVSSIAGYVLVYGLFAVYGGGILPTVN